MVNDNPFSVLETDLQGNGNVEGTSTKSQINGKEADLMSGRAIDNVVWNEAHALGNIGELHNIEENNEVDDDLFGNLFESNINIVDHSGKSSSSGMSSPDLSSPNISRPCPMSVRLDTPSSVVGNNNFTSHSAKTTSPYSHLKPP